MGRLTRRIMDEIILNDSETMICRDICNSMDEYDHPCAMCPLNEAIKKLARYEDLEERGRLIELPCKVGDTVYVIYDRKQIKEHMASRFLFVNDNELYIKIRTNRGGLKTTLYKGNAFITKEEALAKLEELKKGVE